MLELCVVRQCVTQKANAVVRETLHHLCVAINAFSSFYEQHINGVYREVRFGCASKTGGVARQLISTFTAIFSPELARRPYTSRPYSCQVFERLRSIPPFLRL